MRFHERKTEYGEKYDRMMETRKPLEVQRETLLRWLKEKENIEFILDRRDRKTHDNQRGRRRYGR